MTNPTAIGKRKETAKQRYIKCLKQLADATGPIHTGATGSDEDLEAFAELANDDFISGHIRRDETGRVSALFNMTITTKGRRLLETLENEEASKTSLGLIKQNRFAAYKWFFGVIGGIVIGWLLKGCNISN